MKQVLVVIDMQNDFITGSLGTPEARAIVPNVVKKIEFGNWSYIVATQDTHYDSGYENYPYDRTLEGAKLPVKHCIHNTTGWNLETHIKKALNHKLTAVDYVTKPTFGSWTLLSNIEEFPYNKFSHRELHGCDDEARFIDVEVEICGLCTDICVISNALMLRAAFPNMKITCDSSCCAGVTPEKHAAALEVMRSCQIDVI